MTYLELQRALATFTPGQLAAEVVWTGDERGGKVKQLWIAEEDWIDNEGDVEARSAVADPDPDATVVIPKGTPQLLVD